jgi:hypothetical protein
MYVTKWYRGTVRLIANLPEQGAKGDINNEEAAGRSLGDQWECKKQDFRTDC